MSNLNDIPCTFRERKWMRSQKAWRCSVELPQTELLASCLTGMIDEKVAIEITGDVNISINPAFIVDVPHKGKKFLLIFETCFEQQANLGPYLTALPDTSITLTIKPAQPEEEQRPVATNSDPLTPKEIKGLHVGFFRNERFYEFLHSITGITIADEAHCKHVFKDHFQVESCKDIAREEFTDFVRRFNEWLR